jgi:hypothetical protein
MGGGGVNWLLVGGLGVAAAVGMMLLTGDKGKK